MEDVSPELLDEFNMWFREQGTARPVRVGDRTLNDVKAFYIGGAAPEVYQFIVDHVEARALSITSDGCMVDEAEVISLHAKVRSERDRRSQQKRVTEKEQVSATPPATSVQSFEEPPPMAPSPMKEKFAGRCHRAARKNRKLVDWQLCDEVEARRELQSCSQAKSPHRWGMLASAAEWSVRRLPIVQRHHLKALQELASHYPNFGEVVEDIARNLQFGLRLKEAVRFPPLLLLGEPGIGKTAFAMALAEALGMSMQMRSFADMTASWVLTGSTSKWSEARCGVVAELCIGVPDGAAPMMIIDEVDKTSRNALYPPDRALLSLLEGQTAAKFRDENLDIELDARPISWILTANDLDGVSEPIRSRATIYSVPPPRAEQLPAIVRSVDSSIRKKRPSVGRIFQPLDDDVVQALCETTPRALGKLLEKCYGEAVVRGHPTGRLRLAASLIQELQAGAMCAESWAAPTEGLIQSHAIH